MARDQAAVAVLMSSGTPMCETSVPASVPGVSVPAERAGEVIGAGD